MSEPLEHLDWRTFMKASDDMPATSIAALDKYFSQFVALPIKDDEDGKPQVQTQKCAGCGEMLTGIFGTWRWGIAHGAGLCGGCGWPSYGHHFIRDENGEDVVTLRGVILQVHPDFVERRERQNA
jgi:hypothetical protein